MRLQEASSFLLRLERVVGLVIFNINHRHLGEVWQESVVMVTNENRGDNMENVPKAALFLF